MPSAFCVEYKALVDDEHVAERILHQAFDRDRVTFDLEDRTRKREFFKVDTTDVIKVLRSEGSCEVLLEWLKEKPSPSSLDQDTPRENSTLPREYHVANSNLPRVPEVKEWLLEKRKQCADVVARVYEEKVEEGFSAEDLQLRLENGTIKMNEVGFLEDFYLLQLHMKTDEVLAFQWHF